MHALLVAESTEADFTSVVVSREVYFRAQARYDDLVEIISIPEMCGASALIFRLQDVRMLDNRLLVEARVTLASLVPLFTARRIPGTVRQVVVRELAES